MYCAITPRALQITFKFANPEALRISLPNCRYPNLSTFRVIEEVTEELEERLEMRFEALNDVLEHSVEDVDANFTVDGLWGHAGLLEEGQEGWPVTERDLNGSNRGNDPRS